MEVPVHRLSVDALKDRLRAAGLSDEVGCVPAPREGGGTERGEKGEEGLSDKRKGKEEALSAEKGREESLSAERRVGRRRRP